MRTEDDHETPRTMRIAIATPQQAPQYEEFLTEYITPDGIRERIRQMVAREDEDEPRSIVTMNRTVLDMVTSADAKNAGLVFYEDVVVWQNGTLVPLLEIHNEDWLAHFSLGDLFERGHLSCQRGAP